MFGESDEGRLNAKAQREKSVKWDARTGGWNVAGAAGNLAPANRRFDFPFLVLHRCE